MLFWVGYARTLRNDFNDSNPFQEGKQMFVSK